MTDYTKMDGPTLLHELGMDGYKWLEAATQHGLFAPEQRDLALTWVCNMIMAGYDHARGNPPINGDHAAWLQEREPKHD